MALSDVKDLRYYRIHLDEAKKLISGRCKTILFQDNAKGVFIGDRECSDAYSAVQEHNFLRKQEAIIDGLEKFIEKIKPDTIDKEYKDKYDNSKILFSRDMNQAQDFIASCIEKEERVALNTAECMASAETVIKFMKRQLKEEKNKIEKEIKFKEYYRQYFKEYPEEVDKLLNGRCKDILANPWYNYDISLQDRECDSAVIARKASIRDKRLAKFEKEQRESKDLNYFKDNIEEAEQVMKQCQEGTVEVKQWCGYASQVVESADEKDNKRKEFEAYYKTHLMAAKFQLLKCNATMTSFSPQCEAAKNIIDMNLPQKTKDPEKEKEFLQKFKKNPELAQQILQGRCKDLMANKWYYLDENMQDEECDAAERVLKKY